MVEIATVGRDAIEPKLVTSLGEYVDRGPPPHHGHIGIAHGAVS